MIPRRGWRRPAVSVALAVAVAAGFCACTSAPATVPAVANDLAAVKQRLLDLERALVEQQVAQIETEEQLELAKARLADLRARVEGGSSADGSAGAAADAELFDAAWADAKSERCEPAVAKFERFIASEPRSALAPLALLEMARCQRRSGDWRQALAALARLERDFGEGAYLPAARLEAAEAYAAAGDLDLARSTLTKLVAEYPYSPASAVAARRLRAIRY